MSCSITLKELSYENSSKKIFENVNLNVGHEEKVAIVGANGAGKSTLLRVIAGLEYSYKGDLELFHNKISSKKEYKKFRSDIGYLPQDVNDYFLCPVVIEDVMFNLRAKGINKEEAYCKALNILESMNISHLKDRTIFDLSGGEQKIVALASILITEPKILLLDEPTNALDSSAEKRVVDILNSIKKSMIIVSHHKTFIQKLAPTVYTLNKNGLELN
ncbi:cobalt ABC transporter ATP-binding protein [Malaciobacter halophilus]|uniref:Cobalt ABC transporter ATP-binding protein n=1 Tax=Malaciobacter halophilus TaxID=197482 RepID=A0A2N1IZX3_9BACT|nr:ABC transporter ATP-binding protein [Malaciobacter halophilus]AXH10532.1 cobalt/nickel ECF transporter CbiMNQO, A component, ATP-binding protein CbiO [Malaciobacter halophilus]PKI79851.1 cobalt ABC transporter ATP-binding protein [Malaciobacter halophilus]